MGLAGVAAVGQSAPTTGISHPEAVVIDAQPDETVTVRVSPAVEKPTAAVPLRARPGYGSGRVAGSGQETARGSETAEVYGSYVPYRGAGAASGSAAVADPDGQIVMSVEEVPGELREGTMLRARTRWAMSTATTEVGAKWTAELTSAVENRGRVVLPVGSVVEGRVTQVHGGRRISGAAMLHLEAKSVVLPDGTRYGMRAQLVDTDEGSADNRVDGEGTIKRREHGKETLAVVGGVTGAAAVAGALVGGGVGAAVGAGIGAGVGTIVWLKEDRQATLPAETMLVFSLLEPMEVRGGPVER